MIESGTYKAVKQATHGAKRLLFTYEGKGAFGELALMYNCPRAATVVVSSWPPAVVHTVCKSVACLQCLFCHGSKALQARPECSPSEDGALLRV